MGLRRFVGVGTLHSTVPALEGLLSGGRLRWLMLDFIYRTLAEQNFRTGARKRPGESKKRHRVTSSASPVLFTSHTFSVSSLTLLREAATSVAADCGHVLLQALL